MRSFKMFLCAAALTFFAAGCSDSDSDSANNDNNTNPPTIHKDAAVDVQMTEAALTAADVPAVDAVNAQKWGENLNAFGSDFMHKIDGSSSFVFSPFSLHSALSMTACGANGDTLKEMADVLHVSNNAADIAKDSGAMRLNLRFDGQTEGSKFSIANRIWVDSTSEVVPTFKNLMAEQFKAPLQIVDFIGHASEIVGIINEWVSNVTNDMIKDLLSPGDVDSDTRMVLVNAIHFDGEWKTKFLKNHTDQQDFMVKGVTAKKVDMMNMTANMAYYENADYKAIVMPYVGDKFSMIFMLPNENDKLSKLVADLSEKTITSIMAESKSDEEVRISLPRYKIETKLDNTVKILKDLGMKLAFAGADFSQMISNESVQIGDVIHKAVIEVDEEGTRAAAATAVEMVKNGVSIDVKDFKADHPFAFALVHNASNGILFAGQYLGE